MRQAEPCVAGVNVVQARKAMEKILSAELVARAMERLAPADREVYLNATPVSWVPLRIVTDFTEALSAESGWSVDRIVKESAKRATEDLMNGLWRVLLRFTSDDAIISRTPVIYGKTYNVGQLASHIVGTRATVTLTDWPTIPDAQITGLGMGIETVLRCAGRKDVKLTWKRTPQGAVYDVNWRG
jgi:hypothetical protein